MKLPESISDDALIAVEIVATRLGIDVEQLASLPTVRIGRYRYTFARHLRALERRKD